MDKEILTIEEVAQYLRVSERTVYDWAQKGEIPCGKLGTSWRFKRADILDWVNRKIGTQPKIEPHSDASLQKVLVPERCVILDGQSKTEALKELVALLSKADEVSDPEELEKAIFKREELMSTGIGLGVGLPHVRLKSIKNVVIAFGVTRTALEDYEALDSEPVQIIAMIAASHGQHAQHIKLLSQISDRLKSEQTRKALIKAGDGHEIYTTLFLAAVQNESAPPD